MKRIICFHYVPVIDEEEDLDLYGLADIKDVNYVAQIKDAVSSYIETVDEWGFADLVLDVLRSFDPDAKLIDIPTIYV